MVPPPDYEIDPQADFASEKVEAIRAGQSTPTELSLAEMELQVEIIGNLGSYTLSGLSSTYFDQNGFINANGAGWNEMSFSSLKMHNEALMGEGSPISTPDFDKRLQEGAVGIYAESINASTQYNWDLATDLGVFKLYSPIQDFSATYPSLHTKNMSGPQSSELGIQYATAEVESLAAKFGTLPTSETALARIQNRTKEMASLIATTRKKKLTFSKSNNNYKLNSSDLYGILSSESTQNISLNMLATTGSNVRESEDVSRGRTGYSSYTT